MRDPYEIRLVSTVDGAGARVNRWRVVNAATHPATAALKLQLTRYEVAVAMRDALNAAFAAGMAWRPPGRDPRAAPWGAWPFTDHRTMAEVMAAEGEASPADPKAGGAEP